MRHAWIVLGVAAACSAANAQEARRSDIQLSGSVVYDSNVARSDEARAALRGLKLEDVIFTPTLSVDLQRPFGRQALFLHGSVGYDFYKENHVLNAERLDLGAGFKGRLGPCRTTFTAGYARHQSDLEDLTLVVTRNVEDTKSLSLESNCARTVGLGLTGTVSQEWDNNSATQMLPSDHRNLTASLGIAYRRPSFGELSLYGQYGKAEFPNRLVIIGGVPFEDGYQVYAGIIRYQRKLGARLEGTVSAGYTSLDPATPGAVGFEGLTYSMDATVRATSRVRAHAAFSRDVKPSNRPDTSYSVDRTFLVEATYALGPRSLLSIGGSRYDSRLEGAALSPSQDLTSETINSVFSSLRVEVSRRLALTFDARREERDASLSGFGYASTRLGVSAAAKF